MNSETHDTQLENARQAAAFYEFMEGKEWTQENIDSFVYIAPKESPLANQEELNALAALENW